MNDGIHALKVSHAVQPENAAVRCPENGGYAEFVRRTFFRIAGLMLRFPASKNVIALFIG
ncbi:hypothetical protein BVD23_05215 [Salmonella enterica]|nr:hypothetical protein [Salmonella enterica]EAN4944786.1 hypothetical protein [Salmonella enterica]EBI7616643.1 hypothetical protein [Salmonella enterica]EBI8098306.1 hypothetical protein [Salmonella enterica]EBK3004343.1 hypothetical protein [Salmonella enterica]